MSLELHELVAEARSFCSTRVTDMPRPAASRAMPAPLMPPPTTRRSMVCWSGVVLMTPWSQISGSEGTNRLAFPSRFSFVSFVSFVVSASLVRKPAEPVPPEQPEGGLGVGDHAVADPFARVGNLRLEGLEVLA